MPSQSANPSTVTATGTGNVWTNASNAAGAANGTLATVSADGLTKSLSLGAAGFGFTIPAGATITGIVVSVYVRGGYYA